MNISELLRGLADTLDSIAGGQEPEQNNTANFLQQTKATQTINQQQSADASDELGEFMPPLQAKLELLKKAVDVPNYYDEAGNPDELVAIKRNAGINPVALDELANDEPFEG
jgi:hypothetical protein